MEKINGYLWEAAQQLSTAEVSDALDFFKLKGSALGIGHITGSPRIFGQAFTVRYAPVDEDNPGTVGNYLDQMPIGSVAVLDNGGRIDCTVWGGILSRLASHKKLGGTVINGVCRDTDEAERIAYPIYARGRFMRTGKDRVQVEAVGEPVSLGDVRVCLGDLIVADRDGVVVVARQHIEKVLQRALETSAVEKQIVEAALTGMSIAEAREKFGYHTLQRSPE